jgi:hypothetical protein
MIALSLRGMHGGHVPCGVTAHGSPGGPLQFDRLEAALAASIPTYRSRLLPVCAQYQDLYPLPRTFAEYELCGDLTLLA